MISRSQLAVGEILRVSFLSSLAHPFRSNWQDQQIAHFALASLVSVLIVASFKLNSPSFSNPNLLLQDYEDENLQGHESLLCKQETSKEGEELSLTTDLLVYLHK